MQLTGGLLTCFLLFFCRLQTLQVKEKPTYRQEKRKKGGIQYGLVMISTWGKKKAVLLGWRRRGKGKLSLHIFVLVSHQMTLIPLFTFSFSLFLKTKFPTTPISRCRQTETTVAPSFRAGASSSSSFFFFSRSRFHCKEKPASGGGVN